MLIWVDGANSKQKRIAVSINRNLCHSLISIGSGGNREYLLALSMSNTKFECRNTDNISIVQYKKRHLVVFLVLERE